MTKDYTRDELCSLGTGGGFHLHQCIRRGELVGS